MPLNCVSVIWGVSSFGRASALQAEGDEFETHTLHVASFFILNPFFLRWPLV